MAAKSGTKRKSEIVSILRGISRKKIATAFVRAYRNGWSGIYVELLRTRGLSAEELRDVYRSNALKIWPKYRRTAHGKRMKRPARISHRFSRRNNVTEKVRAGVSGTIG